MREDGAEGGAFLCTYESGLPLLRPTVIANWRAFIYYLCKALEALPSTTNTVYRGIGIKFDLSLYGPGVACLASACFMVGSEFWASMGLFDVLK